MTGSPASEDALVEQPALEWLRDAGWALVHGAELAAEALGAERKIWSDVVLIGRLREAVAASTRSYQRMWCSASASWR